MKRFFRNLFVRNWGLKLFSLILAFLLWLTFIPEEKVFSEKTLTIPLETFNIPPEIELVEKPVAMIDVTVRAPNRLINQISAANVYAKLDLEKATVFQEEFPLNTSMISIPQGGEVIRISPNKVKLKLEKTKQILLEVVPTIIGELQAGYRIEKVEVIPPKVPVKGPESKIREKDKVRTSPVEISPLTQSTEFVVDVILPRPELRLAGFQTTVRIRIIIQPQPEEGRPPDVKKAPGKKFP